MAIFDRSGVPVFGSRLWLVVEIRVVMIVRIVGVEWLLVCRDGWALLGRVAELDSIRAQAVANVGEMAGGVSLMCHATVLRAQRRASCV